jgi:DNA-binding MarR family transcriptional regulator
MRIANEAWEALFRAQATIAQELSDSDVWAGLVPREYGVLYALSKAPNGLRIKELLDDVLLTQPGMSRLISRLEARGLVERGDDPDDGRACRAHLTEAGVRAQRHVGVTHGQQVAMAMTRELSREQLVLIRDLCRKLIGGAGDVSSVRAPMGASRS